MSKHTPGPWSVTEMEALRSRNGIESLGVKFTLEADGSLMSGHAAARSDFDPDGQFCNSVALANVRLIAEAPLMLEALRKVYDLIVNSTSSSGRRVADVVFMERQIGTILERLDG